jgi:mannose-6-phosphate isomerase-like protein (cupin superfamily)
MGGKGHSLTLRAADGWILTAKLFFLRGFGFCPFRGRVQGPSSRHSRKPFVGLLQLLRTSCVIFKRKEYTFIKTSEFPAFLQSLPEADLPYDGLRGWLLQSESGQVLFNESDIELTVPEHSHGSQWGVVIDGKIDLTIGDQTQTYTCGDTYFIPPGTLYQARIYPGFRTVDYFANQNRYRIRLYGA